MKKKIKFNENIILIKNGKFAITNLKFRLSVECNCEDDSLLSQFETEYKKENTYANSIFIEETSLHPDIVAIEDAGLCTIYVIDSYKNLVEFMIKRTTTFISDFSDKIEINSIQISI